MKDHEDGLIDADDLDAELEAMKTSEIEEPEDPAEPAGDEKPEEPAAAEEQQDDDEPLPGTLEEAHKALREARERERQKANALKEERKKRQNVDPNSGVYQQRLEALEKRFADMTPQQQADAQEDARRNAPPSIRDNPLQALEWAMERIQTYEQVEQQRAQEYEQQTQQQRQMQAFTQSIQQDQERFAAENDDYYDAIDFMFEARAKQFQALGHDAATAEQMAKREALSISAQAIQANRSPAEVAYAYARTLGFSKQPEAPAAPPEKKQPTTEKIKAGQAASPTQAPNTKPQRSVNINDLLADDDDDPLEALHRGEETDFDRKFASYRRRAR